MATPPDKVVQELQSALAQLGVAIAAKVQKGHGEAAIDVPKRNTVQEEQLLLRRVLELFQARCKTLDFVTGHHEVNELVCSLATALLQSATSAVGNFWDYSRYENRILSQLNDKIPAKHMRKAKNQKKYVEIVSRTTDLTGGQRVPG